MFPQKISALAMGFFTVLLPAAGFAADTGAGWLRTQTLGNKLNPNISLIADTLAQSGTKNADGSVSQTEDGFSVREVELGVQAEVDPYARADFFIGGLNSDGGAPELEEGYITLLALPGGFQARGGKFRANFGKLNLIHPHEYAQVDAPPVLEQFLGEEGLNSTGAELSRVFAPLGIFSELSYGFLRDLGGEHHEEDEAATTQVTDVNGDIVNVEVAEAPEAEAPKRLRSFAHVARARVYTDVTPASNLEVGFSGALHEPQGAEQRRLAGTDLTFRWKPLQEGLYRSFIWRTEALYSVRKLAPVVDAVTALEVEPAAEVFARGIYSYLEYQPARRWRFGLRGDYSEDPENRSRDTPHITRAAAPYVTFTLSEFNRFRLQYERRSRPGLEHDENLGFFQWTVILGPHGAHPF